MTLAVFSVEDALAQINKLDLSAIKYTLISDKYGEPAPMTPDEVDVAIEHYKATLKLWAMYPDKVFGISRFIDEVWHAHIEDTLKYDEDMNAIFGEFMHHYPYFGIQDAAAAEWLRRVTDEGVALYRDEFGLDVMAASSLWIERRHARMREYFLQNPTPAPIGTVECGNVRCCKACNKIVDGVSSAQVELLLGARPHA